MSRRTLSLAALLLALAGPETGVAVEVTRPVFVASVEQNRALLVWHTQEPTVSIVDYGLAPTQLDLQWRSKETTRTHEVELLRLDAGQKYYYRIRTETETLFEGAEYHFITVPDKSTHTMRFLVWGDSGKGDAAQYSLVPPMVAADADFMLHTGDVIYEDGEAQNFGPRYFTPYAPFLRNTPVYLALGNHDIRTDNGQPYLDAFYLPENNPYGNERYYSFNWGQALIVCMDSNLYLPSEEINWLRSQLESATTLWKFVFWHHPPYSCGHHGSDINTRSEFVDLMEEFGVDIVFTGHEHDYQRTHPLRDGVPVDTDQDPHYKDTDGVIYVVTGGGSMPRPTSDSCSFTHTAISATHFTQVDVDGNRLTVQAIDANGNVIDNWTLEKSGPGGTAATLPGKARLLPNIPNPFNPVTTLRYEMLAGHDMTLSIFDLRGRRISTLSSGFRPAGTYQVSWNGQDHLGQAMPSGLYVARLQVGSEHLTRKILLAK